MGLLARTLNRLVPAESKVAIGAAVPTWQDGTPQPPRQPFGRFALEGYSTNEVVYSCIEELATSAAEPRFAAYTGMGKKRQPIETHPILDLLERPNPWTDRYTFVASIIMYLSIAGNAYVEKVRSQAGKVVELWLWRPDRVQVIPDADKFVRGYRYTLQDQTWEVPAQDVIHFRYRNPNDDFYGLPPLAVAARRTDTDNAMRAFTHAFFTNGGVPAGLLNIKRQVSMAEREVIRQRWRGELSGPGGWHDLMVLDNTEASFTPMGMPLGERGLVLPDLDDIDTSRIAMAFAVPPELIGARLSMRGQRSAAREARAGFWDETLVPLYKLLSARLNADLVPEFDDVDSIEEDLSTVQALQEDADALMKRAVAGFGGGVLQRGEARKLVGQEAGPDDEVYFMPRSSGLLDPDETLVPGSDAPELVGTPPPVLPALPPATNGHAPSGDAGALAPATNGQKTAAGRDSITQRDIRETAKWVQRKLSPSDAALVCAGLDEEPQ